MRMATDSSTRWPQHKATWSNAFSLSQAAVLQEWTWIKTITTIINHQT